MVREAKVATPKKKAAKPVKKAPRKRAPKKKPPPATPSPAYAAMLIGHDPRLPVCVDPWDRARKAHEALLAGTSWEDVIKVYDYTSVETATLDLKAYLKFVHVMTGDDERVIAKQLSLDRMDALLGVWYPLARLGSEPATNWVLKIEERRAKLLELDSMSQRQGSERTIIITGAGGMADELRAEAMRIEAGKAEDVDPLDDVAEGEVVYQS